MYSVKGLNTKYVKVFSKLAQGWPLYLIRAIYKTDKTEPIKDATGSKVIIFISKNITRNICVYGKSAIEPLDFSSFPGFQQAGAVIC